MYEYKQLQRDFKVSELGDGAEIYLSGDINGYSAKQRDGLVIISGNMKNGIASRTYSARVIIDEKYDELVESSCGCAEFATERYCCAHTVGLLMAYHIKKKGSADFSGSETEKYLSKKTGVANPFAPGKLKRTDAVLSDILESFRNSGEVQVGERAAGNIGVEYVLNIAEGLATIELKAGYGKKRYVIKNICEFLDAYTGDSLAGLGKDMVKLERESFSDNDIRVLDYLSTLNEDHRAVADNIMRRYGYRAGGTRSIILEKGSFEQLMDLCDGMYFTIDKMSKLYRSEVYKPCLHMEKLEYGADVSIDIPKIIYTGHEYAYIDCRDEIRRISCSDKRMLAALKAFDGGGKHFISEKDLPEFCSQILPAVGESAEVKAKGMELALYMPEKPSFSIYLDYPQKNLISCRGEALYSFGRFGLFDGNGAAGGRNARTESECEKKLAKFFSAFDSEKKELILECDEKRLYDFLTGDLEGLKQVGDIYISDELSRLRARPFGAATVGLSAKSGLLEMKVSSEEFSMQELMEIFSSYTKKKKYHRLKNGSFVSFEKGQEEILDTISRFYKDYGEKSLDMKVPLFRALYLDEAIGNREFVQLDKDREYRKLVKNMTTACDGDFDAPESLKKILRHYQREGFRWMKTLKTSGFSGILADDMGLGKTLQVLAFLLSEKEEGKSGDDMRTLIITPASLVYNWKKELERFVPDLSVKIITGKASIRAGVIDGEDADIWLTTYDLLKRDVAEYKDVVFANQIIDEAQFIKNYNTQASKAVRLINSSFRMALTGTPIENRISELWSIFDYLMPGYLYGYTRFRAEFEAPVMMDNDEEAMGRLKAMVHHFILRRCKKDVLKELPDKLEETVIAQFGAEQRKLYDAYEQRLRMFLEKKSEEEFKNSKIEILAELTKLRQLCCSPELILEDYKGGNAKLEACRELVNGAVDGGHKILIFSQFTSMLDEIEKVLSLDNLSFYRIDGHTSKEKRMEYVEKFQRDNVKVFLISLKAGGTGLNLTAADIVIHYDPWWNLAVQNQATDRTHRIGQKNVVTVYQLIAENTIEDRIQKLQQSKYDLANEVLSGEGISSIMIDRNEILNLLG